MNTFSRTSAIVVLMTVPTVGALSLFQSPVAAQAAETGATGAVSAGAQSI